MSPLNLSKKCTKCGFETTEIKKYFHGYLKSKDGFKNICKKCMKKINDIYNNTEHGFMVNTYNTLNNKINNKRYKNSSEKEKNKHRCHVTKEEFFQLWEEHKRVRGYRCHLSGIKMVCLRATGKKGASWLGYSNGVSVDRLNPNIGYTKNNIIFIANEVNKNKGAVTKEMCIKILETFKEKGL